MGFGTEIICALMLAFLVLGPKRLYTMLASVARAKAKFVDASQGFNSRIAADLDAGSRKSHTDCVPESGRGQ